MDINLSSVITSHIIIQHVTVGTLHGGGGHVGHLLPAQPGHGVHGDAGDHGVDHAGGILHSLPHLSYSS